VPTFDAIRKRKKTRKKTQYKVPIRKCVISTLNMGFRVMVSNATFNSISVISRRKPDCPRSYCTILVNTGFIFKVWGHHGRDGMVVGFTTTCAIGAYLH
jgi:hypothetical protein